MHDGKMRMKYDQILSLEAYRNAVEKELLQIGRRQHVSYPERAAALWNVDQLERLNEHILKMVAGNANVYAIFVRQSGAESYQLRYIGKTTNRLARQRIRNHLIAKHDKTGSVLDKVKEVVKARGAISISWVKVEPESLRNYLEEELIKRHPEAYWNRENQSRLKL